MRSFFRSLRQRIFGKDVTVYPTYGYTDPHDPAAVIIPLRLWVHDNRDTPFVESTVEGYVARHFESDLQRPLSPEERSRLESVLGNFIADDKSGEEVEVTFVDDPEKRVFRLSEQTNHNGVIEENLRVDRAFIDSLMPGSEDGWVAFEVSTTDGNGRGPGVVRFPKTTGLSIVSDIDDTIKVTHVPAGKKTVLKNTFLKPFQAAPGMLERYLKMRDAAPDPADVSFHYVSGSPWQMFAPLSGFLMGEAGFPLGTFHMKDLRKNLLDPGAFDSLRAFVLGGDLVTLDQKVRQITQLILHHPGRDFILVGDAGEKDPEVYRAIQRLFPKQVRRIIIRDVLGDRLKGMELISDADISVFLDTSELEKEMMAMVTAATRTPESPRL